MIATTKNILCFDVPAVPIAQPRQRHRIINGKDGKSFASNYTPTRHPVNDFKASVRMAAAYAYDGATHDGPVMLDVVFVMPRPKNQFYKRKPTPRYVHTKKPDCDNLAKSVKDALSGIIWVDDSQVHECRIRKFVASGDEKPHVEITIELQES